MKLLSMMSQLIVHCYWSDKGSPFCLQSVQTRRPSVAGIDSPVVTTPREHYRTGSCFKWLSGKSKQSCVYQTGLMEPISTAIWDMWRWCIFSIIWHDTWAVLLLEREYLQLPQWPPYLYFGKSSKFLQLSPHFSCLYFSWCCWITVLHKRVVMPQN